MDQLVHYTVDEMLPKGWMCSLTLQSRGCSLPMLVGCIKRDTPLGHFKHGL